MPTNQYGQTEWDADPETAAELRRLANQEKIAAAMAAKGQVPLTGGMVGNTYVGASPLQGLANMFHQYNASRATQGAEEGYKALGDKKAQEYAAAISDYKRNTMGTPGTPEQPMGPPTETGDMGVKPAVPAVVPTPDQRRQAIIEAAVSTNPRLSKMGQLDFQMDARKEDKAAAREDKLFQIQMAHQNNLEKIKADALERRITREEADKRANESKEQMIRLAAGLRQPAAPIQLTDGAGNVKLVDQRGNTIKDLGAVGKPSAGFEKAGAAKKKMTSDLDTAITELEKATADGGLIDKSTGSGAGALVDAAAGFFGKATPGSIAVGQMKPIFDLALKMVPRFEGPQSDKDTASYKEAAGELANPNAPNERKKAAGKEILRLMKARRGQFIDKGIEGTEADIPASGGSSAVDAALEKYK